MARIIKWECLRDRVRQAEKRNAQLPRAETGGLSQAEASAPAQPEFPGRSPPLCDVEQALLCTRGQQGKQVPGEMLTQEGWSPRMHSTAADH